MLRGYVQIKTESHALLKAEAKRRRVSMESLLDELMAAWPLDACVCPCERCTACRKLRAKLEVGV